MNRLEGDGTAQARPTRRRVILIVAESFDSLVEPLRWLSEAGYDVRACLGPLAADRVCGLFEGGCPELEQCDLLITNEIPHPPSKVLPPRREIISEARLRREELPILLVPDRPDSIEELAHSLRAEVAALDKAAFLSKVEALTEPAQTGG